MKDGSEKQVGPLLKDFAGKSHSRVSGLFLCRSQEAYTYPPSLFLVSSFCPTPLIVSANRRITSASPRNFCPRNFRHASAADVVGQGSVAATLRSKNISKRGPRNCRSLHYAIPDFLWNLVALSHFMRPSLRKDAHAALSSVAWQEIRVRSGRDDKGEGDASIKIDAAED